MAWRKFVTEPVSISESQAILLDAIESILPAERSINEWLFKGMKAGLMTRDEYRELYSELCVKNMSDQLD